MPFLSIKLFRGGIDIGRENEVCRRLGRRLGAGQGLVRSLTHLRVNFILQVLQLVLLDQALLNQISAK